MILFVDNGFYFKTHADIAVIVALGYPPQCCLVTLLGSWYTLAKLHAFVLPILRPKGIIININFL